MASGQTMNYQLNQWEAGDHVLRTEFNEDNTKIDAALTEKLGRSEQLETFTLEEANRIITLPLGDMNWDDWETVSLVLDCNNPNGSRDAYYCCSLNNATVSCHCSTSSSYFAHSKAWCPMLLTFLPRHDKTRLAQGVYFGNPGGMSCGACTFEEVTNLWIILSEMSNQFLAGTQITMWGVR